MAEATFLSHPEATRLFVQQGPGHPWRWVGCVTVRNIQLNPRTLEYSRCVDENGITVSTIPRTANPTQFDVAFRGNWGKWQSMWKKILSTSCRPNFFLASAECKDASKVADPTYNDNGVVLYGIDVATAYSVFNNTAIFSDPNQAVPREDQLGFVFTQGEFVRHYQYGLEAVSQNGGSASPIPIKSMAIVDSAACADFICRACDAQGCQQIVLNNGVDFYYTTDDFSNVVRVIGSGIGKAQAFNGNAFAVKATDIRVYAGLDANAWLWSNWTPAVTDVTFAGLSNIAQIDARTMIVGGTEGAVWRSINGGGNWKQVRAGIPATVGWGSFKAIAYNRVTKQLVGVEINAANAVFIQTSVDRGKTWQTVDVALAGKTWAGASEAIVYPAGPFTFVVVDGDIYRVACAAGAAAYEKLSIAGASGDITGIGGPSDDQGNLITLTVDAGGDGKVVKTIDGFNSWTIETLPFVITSGSASVNPIINCSNQYGESLWMAFGQNVYWGRDWDSFFSED